VLHTSDSSNLYKSNIVGYNGTDSMLSFELSFIDLVLIIEVSILLVLHMTTYRSAKKEAPSKKRNRTGFVESVKLHFSRLLPILPSLLLIAFGSIILAWVGWLIWYDVTMWGKDVGLILFGSRTSEAIGLGVGMKVFDYFLIGLAFPLSGLFLFIRRHASF